MFLYRKYNDVTFVIPDSKIVWIGRNPDKSNFNGSNTIENEKQFETGVVRANEC